MTRAARTALINCGTNRQGATPPPNTDTAALSELAALKLLGVGNGLTRRGTIKRQQIMDDILNNAFGEV